MIYTSQYCYYQPGNLHLDECQFIGCSSDYGGGLCVSNSGLILLLSFCVFDSCSSTSHGGGLVIDYSKSAKMIGNTFLNCRGVYTNGYFCDGGPRDLLLIEMNQTTDYCPYLTVCGAYLSGTNHANCNNNNHSYSNTNQHSSGAFYGSGCSETVCQYCLVFKSTGTSFFGVRDRNSDITNVFERINFINNSASIGWIELHHTPIYPKFDKCCFLHNTGTGVYRVTATTGGSPSFNKCYFSIPYNPIDHSIIPNEQNTFSVSECPVEYVETRAVIANRKLTPLFFIELIYMILLI